MNIFNRSSAVVSLFLAGVIIVLAVWWAGGLRNIMLFGNAQPAAVATALLPADNFAILAGTAITNTGTSVITGDVGLSPAAGSSYGAGMTAAQVTGTIYAVDATGPTGSVSNAALLTAAKNALTAAYLDAEGQTPVSTIASELGGTTKTAGVYNTADGELGITGTLTLDAEGDPNAVFIFKAASTLTTAGASVVVLANGAQACNVFWQVGSSATLGINSILKGNILALTSITLTTGARVDGRVLARNGAVTLDTNTITKATCAVPPAPPSSPPPSVAAAGGSREGTLTVVKTIINDNGGTGTVADFPLFVNGAPVISGISNVFPAPALAYAVTETVDSRYARTFSGDCDSTGRLTLSPRDNKFCIITNDDIGTPVIVPPVPPLIDVVKVPNPLALPGGAGPVAYTYTLRNIGTVPVSNVTMVGDTCSPISLSSGDIDADAKLDVSETWVYRCQTTLSETHTNTVVATGWANGLSAIDIASATVVVGAPVVPPLIHVTKIPNPLALLAGGGKVTYTKRITNPGTVPLSNVRLTDDACVPVKYISGDANGDSKLDTAETWVYTCQTTLTKTTTNTAVASGEANGLTVRDFAVATVVVASAAPTLPDTGLAPEAQRAPAASPARSQLPLRITIPKIGVDASIESVGLTAKGAVDVPKDPTNAAWFNRGPRPGESGNAVIDGHFGWKEGQAAVFDDLHTLRAGDKIYVEDEKGATTAFVVREVRTYGRSEEASEVFGPGDGDAHLNLITCGGVWNETENSYSNRLVVFADRATE